MHFKQLNLKKSIFLFFLLTFQFNSFGQDFEWVYNILGTSNSGQNLHYSTISDVVIDNQDNIYILGFSQGEHDFTEGSGNIVINTENVPLQFIVKLDKNKNVLWVKHFNVSENVINHISSLHLDSDQNLFLIGYVSNQGVDFIDLDPDPSEQQTIVNPSILPYGLIIKLNANGTYIDSWDFENYIIRDLAFDSEEEIIITATIWSENFGEPPYETAKVFKFDSNLNIIWTKVFDGFSIRANDLIIDNLNGIIIKGTYKEFLIFDEENLQNENGNFICKLNPDGTDGWIIDLRTSVNSGSFQTSTFTPLYIDNNNNLYTTIRYRDNDSFKFKNITLTGLPYVNEDETVLFNFDSNGNYKSHLTFSGSSLQNISSFAISEFNEFIIGIRADNEIILRNSDNQEIGFLTTEGENALLKISEEHQFIDYIDVDHMIGKLQFDSENNIIMGTLFFKDTDFDPHPINEFIVPNKVDRSGYVLKLSYCDAFPPTGDDLIFCSDENPTVADLEANEYNISWYSSLTSTDLLDDTIALQDGQTYYAKKNKEDNCPEIFERLAVLVTVNPTPQSPILDAIQPCFSSGLTLADLNIDATKVYFFATLTTTVELSGSTTVEPDLTYYMSQTVAGCESERVAFTIPAQSNVAVNDYTVILCDSDRNNFEQVNLSNYISFLLNGNPNDFTISYHNTQVDAENGSNPIQNFEEYQSNTQNIYVRFLNNAYSCYEIAMLTISVSFPPEITEIITRDETSSSNSITVLPSNPQYLYSIDGTNYQSSNVFDNVLAGEYLVYVKDSLEACAEVTEKVYLLTYPKFFTPNGDGYNDFWKIKYAQFQFAVDVEIYDRYGKLLTSFDKNSPGWDGKYNGENLPSTDYWFKVMRFIDKKVIHKGHFSLKR